MAHECFRDTGEDPFLGNLVYDRVVPPNHFLRQPRECLDWEDLTQDWVAFYKGGVEPSTCSGVRGSARSCSAVLCPSP